MGTEQAGQFPRSEVHVQAIANAIEIAHGYPDAVAFLVLDVDEVVFATRAKLAERLYIRLCEIYPHLQDTLPKPENALKNGIRKTYEPLIHKTAYETIWKSVEDEQEHLKDAPLTDPALPEILDQLIATGIVPILLLTARDEKDTELTEKEAEKNGIKLPVFAMYPGNTHITPMKIGVLQELAHAIGKPMIMIDDSLELIVALQELKDPMFIGILYETDKSISPEIPIERRGVWQTIPPTLTEGL
jgi:hypothetical protein